MPQCDRAETAEHVTLYCTLERGHEGLCMCFLDTAAHSIKEQCARVRAELSAKHAPFPEIDWTL